MPRAKRTSKPVFTKLLCELMEERGIGVREAGRIAGVSPSTVSGWMSGSTPDNFLAIQKLARKFGVTTAFLLTGLEDSGLSSGTVTQVFGDGGTLFEGYAKISIQKLIPRAGVKK